MFEVPRDPLSSIGAAIKLLALHQTVDTLQRLQHDISNCCDNLLDKRRRRKSYRVGDTAITPGEANSIANRRLSAIRAALGLRGLW
jgi:hypothetical protein